MATVPPPESIQLIGTMVAIRWPDGREDFYPMDKLRSLSPSADNIGEPDIFGNIHGADPRTEFPGVTVNDFEIVGRYAVRFIFSDGHQTGLFSFPYLLKIGDEMED
jgi:DUF971 family protein